MMGTDCILKLPLLGPNKSALKKTPVFFLCALKLGPKDIAI